MSLQEENEDLRQELERVKTELIRLEELSLENASGRKHRSLRNAQTQELEDLMVEYSQIQEQLKSLEDENLNLKKTVELQRDELKALEATDKSKVIEEDGKKKSKLHLLKDKVNMMQKQIKEDHLVSEMLAKERKLTKSLEKQLEDATARWKEGREEVERMHDDLLESEKQNQRHQEAYEELCRELEELKAMQEAEGQARSSHAEHLNEQLMMLLTPTPVNDKNEGNFNFGPARGSISGQDLLTQLSHLPEDESPCPSFLDSVPACDVADRLDTRPALSAPETAGESQERLVEMQGECQRLNEELQHLKQQLQAQKDLRGSDARRELALREEREAALRSCEELRQEVAKAQEEVVLQVARLQEEKKKLEEECEKLAELGSTEPEEVSQLRLDNAELRKELENRQAESRRLQGECAKAIREECATAKAEMRKLQEAVTAALQEADEAPQTAAAAPAPAAALPAAAPAAAVPRLAGAAVESWQSETSMNSRVAQLEEELERTRKQLEQYQKATPEQSSWSKVLNSFMCTSR